jgi:hypothetical protein
MKLLQTILLTGALLSVSGVSMAANHIHHHYHNKQINNHYGHGHHKHKRHHRHHHGHRHHRKPKVNLGFIMQPGYVYPNGYYTAPSMTPAITFTF